MPLTLEVILTPAEFELLQKRDLSRSVCVVFDILRAGSTILAALAAGAEAVIPMAEIDEALAYRAQHPGVLLGGEREGRRIRADQTGGTEFDLGNSPREYTPDKVRGQRIVTTTTNGTRALRACAGARRVLIGSFLNFRVTCEFLEREIPEELVLVCSGTFEQPALEDILAAGAFCERLWPFYAGGVVSDSAELARRIYPLMQANLQDAMKYCRNGRRLLATPDLRDDVRFCLQRETLPILAELQADGAIRRRP